MAKLTDPIDNQLPQGTGAEAGKWGKFIEGRNVLRLVSEWFPIYYMWDTAANRGVVLLSETPPVTYDEAMAGPDEIAKRLWQTYMGQVQAGNTKAQKPWPQTKFMVNAIDLGAIKSAEDLKDPEKFAIRHYELPVKVVKAIQALAFDPEYAFDDATGLPPYDIIVTKTKTGNLATDVEYTVTAGRTNRPLTDREKELIKGCDSPEIVISQKKADQLLTPEERAERAAKETFQTDDAPLPDAPPPGDDTPWNS